MAGDLAARGFRVHFYEHPNFASSFSELLAHREITLSGALGRKSVKLDLVTTDLREALAGVKLINLVVPSTAQRLFFAELAGLLSAEQILVVWAGRFGSLAFVRQIQEQGRPVPCTIAETDTLPYGVRKTGPGAANILYTARRLYAASTLPSRSEEVWSHLHRLYPLTRPLNNVLEAAFSNDAPLVLGIGALLNTPRIEQAAGDFFLLKDGITAAVAEVMYRAHQEIVAVAQAFQLQVPQYSRQQFDGPASIEAVCFESPDGLRGFAGLDGPKEIRGRYMLENIGDTLVPITDLGDLAGIDTPVLDAAITLGSVVCGIDFRKEGRNLQRLGLAGKSLLQLQQEVSSGFGGEYEEGGVI